MGTIAKHQRYAIFGLLTTAAYIASAKLGLTLAFVAEQVTVVWPPTGIALAVVLLLGYRIWPFIALGAFIANITTNTPVITSLGIATGNTLEALAGAFLLNRFVGIRPSLDRFRDVFGLLLYGAVLSTMVSATIGTVSLCLTDLQPWHNFGALWSTWFLGDAMGNVVFAPLVMTLFSGAAREQIRRRLTEFIALVALLIGVGMLVFGGIGILDPRFPAPDYAFLPVLIWAALRLGILATAFSIFVSSTMAVLGTVKGFGPFSSGSVAENLISVELYMFVAAVTGLIIAVAKTERDKAEASLHRSEQRYRSLVLASAQVVWRTNAAGEVTEDLPTWRTFTGQAQEDMMGLGWAKKLHPDDLEQVTTVWHQSLATGTPNENEFRVMAGNGEYRYVHARAVPVFESDGTVREWIGTLSDVTARKLAEQEVDEASRRKDEFLAMLAHELRNPLAPIRSAVEVIRSSSGNVTRIAGMCDMMVRQIHHMGRLLDDLLDVSRITRGTIQLDRQSTDLRILLERCLEPAQMLAEKKAVRVTTRTAAGPVAIRVDVTRMEQVISNLLNNAMKFTPSGGQITITVEREAEWAVLRVQDTGRGISADFLPKVFDLFTQADRTLARSEGGLGIGLTLVRDLVRMHHGVVEARSDGPGRGSEFVVKLPMMTAGPSESTVETLSRRAVRGNRRILIIEDNVDSAQALAAMLQLLGYESHVAYDGVEGLQSFSEVDPGVVLVDIGLPRMNGYEVAQRLRAGNPQLKLIAVTGYGSNADRQRAFQAGFDVHLVKPVDVSALEQSLAE